MLCLAALLAASSASATSPPPITSVYPNWQEQGLPSNPLLTVHAAYGHRLDPDKVLLFDGLDNELPVTLTPEADARGSIEVKPSAPLSPGVYRLKTGFEEYSLNVNQEADTAAPSAIVEPSVAVERGGKDRLGDITIVFAAPTDNDTPSKELGYDIWVSKAPAEPDLEGKPTLMATTGSVLEDGKVRVSLAPGGLCITSLPSDASGRFIARLRARDAAGNLGPASAPIQVEVDEVPKCRSFWDDSGEGCTAAPMLAPAAWVALALWLRRRRR
ncbi:hypothetical protein [Hyalangium sp.]|uniref:hypothetical protein n=1 Tax=Hyalangium sp. TaxID=2028555 RepID=UPI002D2A3DFA|nr:hypothetical protein [Hyalangium sp.]HYH95313.1 hypothetical protein [Hyalangium sp.]